jgi:anti-repressor protein
MNELIKITETNGKKAVSARDLHSFLESKKQFADWIKHRITKYGLIENIDYQSFSLNGENGGKSIEYALSLDAAKELSMVEGNTKGKQARKYFIDCEKKYVRSLTPLTEIEILQRSLTMLMQQEKKVNAIEQRVQEIENKPQINAPVEHFSILGFCHNIGKQISLNEAKSFGIKCRALCNQLGFVIGKIADPRFGSVNTYPLDVLKQVIQ